MKKLMILFVVMAFALSIVRAQNPPAAPPGGAAKGGGGQRPPAVPPVPAPLMDIANKIADAINKQDAASLTKLLDKDVVYLDEDGHAPPAAGWVTKLTTGTPAKKIEISATHGQLYTDTGWFSFNYTVSENYQDKPVSVKGTASAVVKKAPTGEWLITLIHGALYAKVAGMTTGE